MILVFGKTGQVATALGQAPEVTCLDRAAADLTDPAACAEAIRAHAPAAVINAAAYNAVDRAEDEPDLAMAINGTAPGAMAEACAGLGIPMVHISTDYVFDGSGTAPWQPDDAPAPLGAYARSKRAGEVAVMAAGGTAVVLRVSWVFSATGGNFVKTMLRLGAEKPGLRVVDDQIGGPTFAPAIADACLTIAHALRSEPAKAGLYHFSGAPDVSWAEFAQAIMAEAGFSTPVTPIPSSEYPTPAPRPKNSRLDCRATEAAFGLSRPDWRQGLAQVVAALRPA